MSDESEALPHIYHTISELKMVKDVRLLNNTYVKTIGYFNNGMLYDVIWETSTQGLMDTENSISLDLTHLTSSMSSGKAYLISAVIFTADFSPVLTVKTAKRMDVDLKTLLLYHQQLLLIRKRTHHFKDLEKIARQNGWI